MTLSVLTIVSACSENVAPTTLSLLYSSNTHAYTKLCGCCGGQMGGLSRRASLLCAFKEYVESHGEKHSYTKKIRKQENFVTSLLHNNSMVTNSEEQAVCPDDFLILDCGSFSDDSSESSLIQSKYTTRAMNLMRYDAVNLGEREVRLTQERLLGILEELKDTPVVSANIEFEAKDNASVTNQLEKLTKEYVTTRVGRHNIIVTGVVTLSSFGHEMNAGSGIRVVEPATALKALLTGIKGDSFVIVLSNGLSKQEVDAIKGLKLVDCLIGLARVQPVIMAKDQQPAAEAGMVELADYKDRGRELGRADLRLDIDQAATVLLQQSEPVFKDIDEHPLIAALVKEMDQEVTNCMAKYHEEMSKKNLALTVDYRGIRACKQCHEAIVTSFQNTRHARAIKSLEKTGDSGSAMCLPCHTTGYGEPTGYSMMGSFLDFSSVSCEACHGPAEIHLELVRQQDLTGPTEGLDEMGLLPVTEATCRRCHTEITNPDFNYETQLPKIMHPQGR